MTNLKPLNLSEPMCTRKQRLKFVAKTADNKLIFEGCTNMRVITTDMFGRNAAQKNATYPVVYNGTPETVVAHVARSRFAVGDIVYTMRPLSRKTRRVLVGRVEGFADATVAVRLISERPKFTASKQQLSSDGLLRVPGSVIFATTEELQAYLSAFQADFNVARAEYTQAMNKG